MPIASVHDALAEAVIQTSTPRREPQINLTIRLHPEKKALLKKICSVHGTTASDFLRSCADSLLKDYIGREEFERLADRAPSESEVSVIE